MRVEEIQLSRRDFVKGGFLLASAYGYSKIAPLVEFFQPSDIINPDRFKNHWAAKTRTNYSSDAALATQILSFGDSIENGRLNFTNGSHYSEGEAIKTVVNNYYPGSQWRYKRFGVDGADSNLLDGQLTTAINQGVFGWNTDIHEGSGTNDVFHRVMNDFQAMQDIHELEKNGFNLSGIDLTSIGMDEIHKYEKRKLRFLINIAYLIQQGRPINRIVIEGIPNLSYINWEQAELLGISQQQREQLMLFLTNNTIVTNLLNALSLRLNDAVLRVLDNYQRYLESTGTPVDVMFIDLYHLLQSKDFVGEHPSKVGQDIIASHYISRTNLVSELLT